MQSYLILYSVAHLIFSTNWEINFLITIYRLETQNLEKLSNLPQLAQVVNCRAQIKSGLPESTVHAFSLIVTVVY